MNETTKNDKLVTMREAVSEYVKDGCSLAIEGFTGFISFAAGHEIIRQKRRDLTLIRMTPDLIYDQMIAAGTAKKLIFSYMGNPGVGSLYCIRRAVEKAIPQALELEEYSHYGLVGRYAAGAARAPFFALRSYVGSDMLEANPLIKVIDDPYGTGKIAVVPPLSPDVAIIHAQRADRQGNTQLWGLLGMQKEVAFASKNVIVAVEELVDESVIRADPNRTLIPGLIVDAVVHEPYGAHPSYVQGYYDRDNESYLDWDKLSQDQAAVEAWLAEWVYGLENHAAYVRKVGQARFDQLKPEPLLSAVGGLREVSMSEVAYTPSEMMIVTAAHALSGARTVFVGVGLPNIACNLAQRTVAPDMELIYESGVYGARPERLPLSIGDPTSGQRRHLGSFDGGSVRFVFAARPGRDRASRRRSGRSAWQSQFHRDRRLRQTQNASSGQRRRLRNRHQRSAHVHDHAAKAQGLRRKA